MHIWTVKIEEFPSPNDFWHPKLPGMATAEFLPVMISRAVFTRDDVLDNYDNEDAEVYIE